MACQALFILLGVGPGLVFPSFDENRAQGDPTKQGALSTIGSLLFLWLPPVACDPAAAVEPAFQAWRCWEQAFCLDSFLPKRLRLPAFDGEGSPPKADTGNSEKLLGALLNCREALGQFVLVLGQRPARTLHPRTTKGLQLG